MIGVLRIAWSYGSRMVEPGRLGDSARIYVEKRPDSRQPLWGYHFCELGWGRLAFCRSEMVARVQTPSTSEWSRVFNPCWTQVDLAHIGISYLRLQGSIYIWYRISTRMDTTIGTRIDKDRWTMMDTKTANKFRGRCTARACKVTNPLDVIKTSRGAKETWRPGKVLMVRCLRILQSQVPMLQLWGDMRWVLVVWGILHPNCNYEELHCSRWGCEIKCNQAAINQNILSWRCALKSRIIKASHKHTYH